MFVAFCRRNDLNMLCHIVKLTKRSFYQMQKTFFASSVSSAPKGFNEIPAARSLPVVGTTLSLILAGSGPKLHEYIDNRHKQLGPIFKEKIGSLSCVFLSDINGMRTVFQNEGKYPRHVLPEAWTKYNTIYNSSRGLFFMEGDEWMFFRKIMNPMLLKGDLNFIEDACSAVADNLVDFIKTSLAHGEELKNLEFVLYKWSLEVMVAVLLGADVYLKLPKDISEYVERLASIIHLVFQTTVKMQVIPADFAAKYRIEAWREFEKSVEDALNSADNLTEHFMSQYPKGRGLLHRMLESGMQKADISKIVTDLILAAGDTTAYSMGWLLYLIGKHQEVQKRLRSEIRCLSQNKELGAPTPASEYLKNVMRESMRLYPIAPFLTRYLSCETTICGYQLPAETLVILSIFTSGRDPVYVENPERFLPDRWLRSNPDSKIVKLSSLPFAVGSRSCVGRKLAECQLQTTLAKIVDNFEIKLLNEANEIDVVLKMVTVPSKPIRLKFTAL